MDVGLFVGTDDGAVSIFGVTGSFLLGHVVLLCPDFLHMEHGILYGYLVVREGSGLSWFNFTESFQKQTFNFFVTT